MNNMFVNSKAAKGVKQDLMLDPRVYLAVKESLFNSGMLMRPLASTMVLIAYLYEFGHLPRPFLFLVVFLSWWINSILYLFLYFHHRAQTVTERQSSSRANVYLTLLLYGCWIDGLTVGLLGLLYFHAKPQLELMIILSMTMYMTASFIKNMAFPKITRIIPALVLLPMSINYSTSDQASQLTMAFYLVLYILVLTIYAPHIANAIQLPIKQRFELEELTSQLNIERDRADAANAAKSHFFTAASHDARQPLQVISLLFQSFQKSTQASEQDKKIIEKIDVNLKTIRNLFDRVLDISRIDSGNVKPNMQSVKLQTLFDKFDAQFGELAASKGLWLRFVPTDVRVQHDSELLDRIVSNLVHNAIKYTPAGGVWVAWRSARGRLEVRDSGLGISDANQHTIFDEFAQINNPGRNNEAGLGLGLSIVKRLADLTETPLGLNSKIGIGSTFWMQLKKAEVQIPPYVSKDTSTNLSTNLTAPNSATANKQAVTTDRSDQLSGMHILYAEDEPQIRELFTQLLQGAGAIVYPCADVTEAIAIVYTNLEVDVVLTDYRLGATGTGLDVVHAARTRQRSQHSNQASKLELNNLPAVILTGDTAIKDLQSIQQLSSSTLLHKPVDFEQLAGILKTVTTPKK